MLRNGDRVLASNGHFDAGNVVKPEGGTAALVVAIGAHWGCQQGQVVKLASNAQEIVQVPRAVLPSFGNNDVALIVDIPRVEGLAVDRHRSSLVQLFQKQLAGHKELASSHPREL